MCSGIAAAFDEATRLLFMQSNGGLTGASGVSRARMPCCPDRPAAWSACGGGEADAGFDQVLGFDMGGTSTDVSHYAGAFERTNDTVVAGVRLTAPMLQIHTVAAGGGSVCFFDGARLRVGPRSAGRDPGPACYRRGGPLTITDCNVLLGRVRPEFFPAIFGPNGDEAARCEDRGERFAAMLRGDWRDDGQADLTPEDGGGRFHRHRQPAHGRGDPEDLDPARLRSARLRAVRVRRRGRAACLRGGGCGGRVATILLHPLAGVLSAWGMGLADLRRDPRAVGRGEAWAPTSRGRIADTLTGVVRDVLAAQGVRRASRRCVTAHLRYEGGEALLPLRWGDAAKMKAEFEELHQQRFGFVDPVRAILVAKVSVEAVGGMMGLPGVPTVAAGSAEWPISTGARADGRRSMAGAGVRALGDLPAGFRVERARADPRKWRNDVRRSALAGRDDGAGRSRCWSALAAAATIAGGRDERSIPCCWRFSTTASWASPRRWGWRCRRRRRR